MALELTLDPPPESQEQTIIGDYNTLASQYPDSGATSVATVDEIDDEKYKELTLNDLNAKRVAFEDSFGLKVEPFTSLEDYQERAPLIIETAKKVYLDNNSTESLSSFEKRLTDFLSSQSSTPKNVQPTVQSEPTQKPFNFNEALGNIPPVGGYGGDVPRETSGKVLEYKLGEAKRKEVEDANQMLSNAVRLRENNLLPDDQIKVLNALQNNRYSGFVPKDNQNIGLSMFGKPTDEELDVLNTRASNISEGNLLEAQKLGTQLAQLNKEIKTNYLDKNILPPPELVEQSKQLYSEWENRRDKASLFSTASTLGIIENYNRQVEKGNLLGDFAVSAVAGLNQTGKAVINTLASLKPSDILKFGGGVDNPLQNEKFDKMFGYDQKKAKKWIQDFNTNNAKGFDKVMYDVMQLSTPEHKEAQGEITKAFSGIIEMLPPMAISMMAGNPYISYSVWAANSYGTRIEEMTKDPRWENASLDEIKTVALPQSLAEAAIMEVGIKNIKGATGVMAEDSHQVIFNVLNNAKNSLVPNSGLTGLKKAVIDGAMKTTSGAVTASGTGASVSVVDDLSKNLYNVAMGDISGLKTEKQEDGSYNVVDNNGRILSNEPTEEKANEWKKRFEPVTPTQIIENGVNSAKDWALMGVMMSAPMTIAGTLKGMKVDARDFAFTKSLVEDPFRVSTMYNTIKNDLATGKIDKEEAQLRIDAIKEFKPIADQIPSTLTPENQRKAFDLLNNINKLEAQKVGKAEGLTGSIDKQIEINKNKLKEIGDAVQDKSKDDYSGSESFLPFTVKEINDGVNYGMKFENTSSDATPKTNDNANNEIQNTESVTTNGQDKVQGQPETNTETIANSVETKNAEVDISESQQVTSKISDNEKGNNEAKTQAKEGDVLKTEVKVGAENAPTIPFIQEVTKNKKAVTLSGNSEVKRQKLIEQRVEKTTLSEGQKSESELAKKVKKFNDMTPSERVKNFRLLNEIKSDAKGRFKVINNGIKGSVEVKAKTKDGGYRNIKVLTSDAGRRSIAPNGKPLHERPQEFQRQFVELIDLGIPFEFRNAEDNSKFKPSQEASALADIYDGIPSEQAEIVLNHVQKAIETNQIEFGDNKQGFGVEQLDKVVAEITQAKNEEAFQSISQKTIEQLYKENADLQEKFDEIIQQEYENIANGVNEKPTEELNGESETTNDSGNTKGLPNESVVEKVQSQEGLEPPKPPSKPKEGVSGGSDDFKKLVHKNIESDIVSTTLSNVERETGRELTTEEKEYNKIKLNEALDHGTNVVEMAKEEFGKDYVSQLLEYLDNNQTTLSTDKKSLIQIAMELDLERQIQNKPDNVLTLEKQLKLVRDKSMAEQRSAARAIGYGRLRQIARVGYDISKITDQFFSSTELESKRTVEKAIQADADTINKQAEKLEQARTDEWESLDNKDLVSEYEKLVKQMDDLQSKIKDERKNEEADRKKFEEETIKKLKAEIAKEKDNTKPAVRTKEVIKAELDKARAQLRIDLAQLSSGGLQAIGSFVEVVKLATELNIKNASAFLKEFRDDLKAFGYSDKEIIDAYNKVSGTNEFETLTKKAIDLAKGELHSGMKSTIDKMLKVVVEGNPDITHVEATDKIYKALKESMSDIDRNEVRDLISGYGKYKLLSKEQVPVAIREIKTLNRLDAGLEAVKEKDELPLRTGMERHEKTEAARKKEAEILRIIKEKGLTPDLSEADIARQYKSAEATYQKRIENAIEDIEKEIETGARKKKSNTKEYNSERSKQLKADLERLKEIRDAKFSEPKKTIGELRIEALRNKIDEINQRVVSTKETKGVEISDADLKTIKDLQEELYQAKQEAGLIKGKEFKSAEEKRLESEANKLENLKSKLDDLLAGKVRDKKISEPDSQEVKDLKAQIKAIEFPPKTEAEKQLAKEDTKEKATQKAIDDINIEIESLKKGETIDGIPTVTTRDGKQIFDIKKKPTDKITNDRIKELEALKQNLKDEKSNLIPAEIKNQAIILKERANRQKRLDALEAQVKDKKYGAKVDAKKAEKPYDMEVESINAKIKSIEEAIQKGKSLLKDALIESGYGMETKVKTKNGIEKRNILDWKKLAGEEGSIERMKDNVSEVLKKKGFTESEITDIQEVLKDEYNDLRASVIESSLNELNKRNQKTLTPAQKSAAKKLAELYNYGLFEKDPLQYEILFTKAIGIDKLNPERFERARELGRALEVMYSTKMNGRKLNDIELKTAIQTVEESMRILLHDEYQQHGSTALKVANIARTYMDLSQRMILNNLKQVVDNTTSGLFQSKMTQIEKMFDGNTTKELRQQARELSNAVFKDMVLQGGVTYGDVNSTFVNRGSLDAYISKMSDNQIYHAITSTLIGKTALDAADSKYKAKLTEFQFTHNLIKILTQKRLINGKVEEGMSKEDALHYVSEKLTGQSFEDAKKTAREIISKVNSGSSKKILHDSELFVTRLANDIVKSALVNGSKITAEQVTMAYNSAYKSAGRNLGHVANNWFSKGVQGISAEIEKKINDASKEKEYKKAALLTLQSIVFRNILNPFVGGGTNWAVLKFEKNGLGLFSGLYNAGRSKLDLSTESGLKNAQKALYEEARDRDAKTRSIVGGLTAVAISTLFFGVTNEDEYRKWRNKNMWAARYLDIFTPEQVLAFMSSANDTLEYYLASLFNKNDSFDKSKKAMTGVVNLVKSSKEEEGTQKAITLKQKAMGKIGEAVGGILNAPIPWRMVRDGQNIWLGATGQEPYKISNKPTTSFFEGAFKASMVDYIKNNPTVKDAEPTLFTKDDKQIPSLKYFLDKDVELPSKTFDKISVKDIPSKTNKVVSDYSEPLQQLYKETHLRIFEKNLQSVINRGYVYKQVGYGESISNTYQKDGVKRKKVMLDDLTKKELEQVLENAERSATNKAKEKVFTRSAQIADGVK